MTRKNKDKTRNQRQAARRDREKAWLDANGWGSWEAIHTSLLRGIIRLEKNAPLIAIKLEERKDL